MMMKLPFRIMLLRTCALARLVYKGEQIRLLCLPVEVWGEKNPQMDCCVKMQTFGIPVLPLVQEYNAWCVGCSCCCS